MVMKRGLFLLLLFVILCNLFIPYTYIRLAYHYPKSGMPSNLYLYNDETFIFHYYTLTDKEKKVYNEYLQALLHLDKKILLAEKLTIDQERKVFEAISHDHPDIFYLPQRKCRYSLFTKKISFCEFDYPYTKEEIEYLAPLLNERIDAIVKEASKLANDYEKVKYVHDVIIDMAEYDYVNYNSNNTFKEFTDYQSVVSILLTGKSVCSGYSKLFQIIMNRLNIKATTFYDNEYIKEGETGHIWNAVYVNDNWYYVDVTWDDNNYDKYMYFLNTYDEFYQTHTVIDEKLV